MVQAGYAQEIITPPVGVGLAGYFNRRPNEGAYDDLYVKVLALEINGVKFGFAAFDLCNICPALFEELEEKITAKLGKELFNNIILSATHTHTGPEYRRNLDDRALNALHATADAALRAIERAFMNLLPATLETASVYNNPYGFVRRYWMKNGTLVTNPPRCSKEIDKPEDDFDRTINILAVRQGGRIAALMCNIGNHGDTIGGNLVSGDWYGRFTQEIQHSLKTSLPVLVVDDASGNINHFDIHQNINQTNYNEATRIGRGYAAIVLDALKDLKPLKAESVEIRNSTVVVPHRIISDAELAEAKHTLETVPDIKKEGDFESQDLANKVPAALRYFAQRVIDCREKSTPSHSSRITSIKIGDEVAFVSLPGEPFNGIGAAIRAKSPCKMTFIIELAQGVSNYVPMPECFPRGGYEVQPGVNTAGPNAADEIIKASLENL